MTRIIELLPGESLTLTDGMVVKAAFCPAPRVAKLSVPQAICKAASAFGSKSAFAGALGIAPANVSQWIKGRKPVPPPRCEQIEALSLGEINRRDLRPDDWARYWPDPAKG